MVTLINGKFARKPRNVYINLDASYKARSGRPPFKKILGGLEGAIEEKIARKERKERQSKEKRPEATSLSGVIR